MEHVVGDHCPPAVGDDAHLGRKTGQDDPTHGVLHAGAHRLVDHVPREVTHVVPQAAAGQRFGPHTLCILNAALVEPEKVAGRVQVDTNIVWHKLRSLVEGARLASEQLWSARARRAGSP